MTTTIPHRLTRYFVVTVLVGTGLHFLYEILPCLLAAVISPVNESIWEHMKLVLYPLLAAALLYTRADRGRRGSWYAAVLLSCALLLGFGWCYHVLLGGHRVGVDIAGYVLIMGVGFLLGARLRVGPRLGRALRLMVIALIGAVILFTFRPPQGWLFADPALADAFYSLPC